MKIAALAGGVGGAKLADGLIQCLTPEDFSVIVNTGDDFQHLGLSISPDLDTVCYTLAGIANPDTGWGIQGDTFQVLDILQKLGGPVWFRLGDRDLATHLERTRRLREGRSLSQITQEFCRVWGITARVYPMSDQEVRTLVNTQEAGELPFQEYFVHRRCEPRVRGFRFAGIESARGAPGVLEALRQADAVIICPSNPWVSIDPILSVKEIQTALDHKLVVAVSPIIGGKTIKGPAAKMYAELGLEPSAASVAEHYAKWIGGFVMDHIDASLAGQIKVKTRITDTIMANRADRLRLAQDVLHFIGSLV